MTSDRRSLRPRDPPLRKGRGAPRDLRQCPYRLHEAVFDGDAVAARYDTRLVVGIDAGMDEQRAFPGMQEVA